MTFASAKRATGAERLRGMVAFAIPLVMEFEIAGLTGMSQALGAARWLSRRRGRTRPLLRMFGWRWQDTIAFLMSFNLRAEVC
jgi:hypothetical protein